MKKIVLIMTIFVAFVCAAFAEKKATYKVSSVSGKVTKEYRKGPTSLFLLLQDVGLMDLSDRDPADTFFVFCNDADRIAHDDVQYAVPRKRSDRNAYKHPRDNGRHRFLFFILQAQDDGDRPHGRDHEKTYHCDQ